MSTAVDVQLAFVGRSLRHSVRKVDALIMGIALPVILMLLFVYVFGGAIETGTDSYVNYMLPGILLITIASGVAYTAARLIGMVRNRSMIPEVMSSATPTAVPAAPNPAQSRMIPGTT